MPGTDAGKFRHDLEKLLDERLDHSADRVLPGVLLDCQGGLHQPHELRAVLNTDGKVIVGSSIVMQTDKGPLLLGFPIFAFLGYTIAGFIGLWWVIAILRSGRL